MPFFIPRNTMWNIKETQCNVNNLSSPSFSGEERGFQSVYSVWNIIHQKDKIFIKTILKDILYHTSAR